MHHELKGAGVEKIAHKHAWRVAKFTVDRGLPPAKGGNINDVIMKQGGRVYKLDNCCKCNMLFCDFTHRRGRQQSQQWTQALAAGVDDVLTDVFDHVDIGIQLIDDQRVYSGEVRLNAGSYVIYQWGFSAVRRDYKVWLSLLPPRGGRVKTSLASRRENPYSPRPCLINTRVPTLCPALAVFIQRAG